MMSDDKMLDEMQEQIPEEMTVPSDDSAEDAASFPSSDANVYGNSGENTPDTVDKDVDNQNAGKQYTNVFSKLMNKIAGVFPEGNSFRSVFEGMADNLESALGKQGYTVPDGMVVGAGSVGLGSAAVSDSVKNSKSQVSGYRRKMMDVRDSKDATSGTGVVKREPKLSDGRVMDQMSGTMDKAADYVSPGEFLDDVDVMPRVRDVMSAGSQRMYQVSMQALSSGDESAAKQVSDNYLRTFEQLQEFDQSMQNKIRLTYEGQDQERAMTKLGEYMRGMVDPMRDSLYEVDHAADAPILNDQARYQLDTMSFTGVKETYSCHEFDRDMQQDDLDDDFSFGDDEFDMGLDAKMSDVSGADRVDTGAKTRDSGYGVVASRSLKDFVKPKQDRGAMAEERFGHIGKDSSQMDLESGIEL